MKGGYMPHKSAPENENLEIAREIASVEPRDEVARMLFAIANALIAGVDTMRELNEWLKETDDNDFGLEPGDEHYWPHN
jgi:hypothetical protein